MIGWSDYSHVSPKCLTTAQELPKKKMLNKAKWRSNPTIPDQETFFVKIGPKLAASWMVRVRLWSQSLPVLGIPRQKNFTTSSGWSSVQSFCSLPSGNLTKLLKMAIYSEFSRVFPLKMVIFHSYVSLPEGIPIWLTEIEDGTWTRWLEAPLVDCPQRPAGSEGNQKSLQRVKLQQQPCSPLLLIQLHAPTFYEHRMRNGSHVTATHQWAASKKKDQFAGILWGIEFSNNMSFTFQTGAQGVHQKHATSKILPVIGYGVNWEVSTSPGPWRPKKHGTQPVFGGISAAKNVDL